MTGSNGTLTTIRGAETVSGKPPQIKTYFVVNMDRASERWFSTLEEAKAYMASKEGVTWTEA